MILLLTGDVSVAQVKHVESRKGHVSLRMFKAKLGKPSVAAPPPVPPARPPATEVVNNGSNLPPTIQPQISDVLNNTTESSTYQEVAVAADAGRDSDESPLEKQVGTLSIFEILVTNAW